jgi:hypothetical protein
VHLLPGGASVSQSVTKDDETISASLLHVKIHISKRCYVWGLVFLAESCVISPLGRKDRGSTCEGPSQMVIGFLTLLPGCRQSPFSESPEKREGREQMENLVLRECLSRGTAGWGQPGSEVLLMNNSPMPPLPSLPTQPLVLTAPTSTRSPPSSKLILHLSHYPLLTLLTFFIALYLTRYVCLSSLSPYNKNSTRAGILIDHSGLPAPRTEQCLAYNRNSVHTAEWMNESETRLKFCLQINGWA